jgi:3D (Asp-Asp-Asp) domain-containing protein
MDGWRLLMFTLVFGITPLVLTGCDDEDDDDSGVPPGTSGPGQADLYSAQQIATAAGADAINSQGNRPAAIGTGDLAALGVDASQNQQAFRARFGLTDPTADQLAQWDQYQARLTAYSNKDADWQAPTAASENWMGTTLTNGDPLAVEGTTVSVDFSRIPRGSLIYIPALNMYAEANDTGATGMWASSDAGYADYEANGAGRVDVYNLAGDRSSDQVEHDFQTRVGSNEFGQIYIVHRGPGWKTSSN